MLEEKIAHVDSRTTLKGRRIATLNVYLDDSTDHPDCSSALACQPDGQFEMWIRPNADSQFMDKAGFKSTMHNYRTVLAHELGHFLAALTQDPIHKLSDALHKTPLAPIINEMREEKAWELAKEIEPELNPEMQTQALNTYAKYRQ